MTSKLRLRIWVLHKKFNWCIFTKLDFLTEWISSLRLMCVLEKSKRFICMHYNYIQPTPTLKLISRRLWLCNIGVGRKGCIYQGDNFFLHLTGTDFSFFSCKQRCSKDLREFTVLVPVRPCPATRKESRPTKGLMETHQQLTSAEIKLKSKINKTSSAKSELISRGTENILFN